MRNNLFDAILAQTQAKQKTEKQQKIVHTAIQLFAEKGYANTSTAEIAKKASVSEGTIFKHYGTKDRLLLSVIIPFLRDLFPKMAQELVDETFTSKTETIEQFLITLMKNRVQFIQQNKEIFQVLFKEFVYNDALRKELLPMMAHVPEKLKHVIDEFKKKGQVIDLPSERILINVLTFLGGFFVSRFLLMNNYIVSDDDIEDAVQFVLNGIQKPQIDFSSENK